MAKARCPSFSHSQSLVEKALLSPHMGSVPQVHIRSMRSAATPGSDFAHRSRQVAQRTSSAHENPYLMVCGAQRRRAGKPTRGFATANPRWLKIAMEGNLQPSEGQSGNPPAWLGGAGRRPGGGPQSGTPLMCCLAGRRLKRPARSRTCGLFPCRISIQKGWNLRIPGGTRPKPRTAETGETGKLQLCPH
jgi:hypothetical protein